MPRRLEAALTACRYADWPENTGDGCTPPTAPHRSAETTNHCHGVALKHGRRSIARPRVCMSTLTRPSRTMSLSAPAKIAPSSRMPEANAAGPSASRDKSERPASAGHAVIGWVLQGGVALSSAVILLGLLLELLQ